MTELHRSTFGGCIDLDEATMQLIVKRNFPVGPRKIPRRIPLSQIEAVRCFSYKQGGESGGTRYCCDLCLDGIWEQLIRDGDEDHVLHIADTVGSRIEDRQKKLKQLADHLSKLLWVAATVSQVKPLGEEEQRMFSQSITLKSTGPGRQSTWQHGIKTLDVEGIIELQGHLIERVEVLHSSKDLCCYYVLGYVLRDKNVGDVRTHRKKEYGLLGKIKDIMWRGGPLADQFNEDSAFRGFMAEHLGAPDCDAHITTDQKTENTVILFGNSCCRQWVKLPAELFPNENRAKAFTALAQKVRQHAVKRDVAKPPF